MSLAKFLVPEQQLLPNQVLPEQKISPEQKLLAHEILTTAIQVSWHDITLRGNTGKIDLS